LLTFLLFSALLSLLATLFFQAILQAALGTALYGSDPAVFLRIGSVLNKYGDWERLVQFYETAVANNIQNADIFTQLGNAYTTLGQEDKALVQYEKAAALAASEQKAVNSEQ